MRKLVFGSALLTAVLGLGVARVHADPACKHQAIEDAKACKADCKDAFRDAKFTCLNVDPACGNPCLTAKLACLESVDEILDTGVLPAGGGTLANCADGTDGCKARLKDAKDACGAPCMSNPTCDTCVDGAQVDAFICRDDCRESWHQNTTVQALELSCRDTFKVCIGACQPAP